MYSYKYPHYAITTDCCIFAFLDNELSVLLIQRGIEPFRDMWALPGGFMRINETAEECAKRELREETGFKADKIRQFNAYSTIARDPRERVITIAYYALVKMAGVRGGDDARRAAWFPISGLPELAFDHRDIINDALMAMRRDIYFEPIGFELLPPAFSMAELQKIVETITGVTYDRRNFYNKMRHMKFVTEIPNEVSPRTSATVQAEEMPDTDTDAKTIEIKSSCCISASVAPDSDELISDLKCRVYSRESFQKRLSKRVEKHPSLFSENEDVHFDESVSAPKTRRSGIKYFFNAVAFRERKNKKGSGPITY